MREPAAPSEFEPVKGTVTNELAPLTAEVGAAWPVSPMPMLGGGRWSKLAARAVADRALNATQVRILAAVGIYADRKGDAWPSQETLATVVGVHRATVCRAIKRLRELGYL